VFLFEGFDVVSEGSGADIGQSEFILDIADVVSSVELLDDFLTVRPDELSLTSSCLSVDHLPCFPSRRQFNHFGNKSLLIAIFGNKI